LPPDSVESVEIKLTSWLGRQDDDKVTSSDATKINTLLGLIRDARATSDHKCGDSGKIVLHCKDGEQIKLGILAGHDEDYYEFRAYRNDSSDIFRVERKAFVEALRDFGVAKLDLGRPE
jgi:hypothetical protein